MWVTDYETDIESDLSAFHRVDDLITMDGPRYFRLAPLLTAYAGVMQARAVEERQNSTERHAPAPSSRASAPTGASKVSHVEDTTALAMLAGDGWAEHATEGAAA